MVCFAEPCPKCNGGFAKQVFEVKERANIPKAFYDSKLNDFDWVGYLDKDKKPIDLSKQKQFIESFINDFQEWEKEGLGLYIYSRMRGSGKTFLASCICNELMAKYPMVTKFVREADLINLAKQDDAKDSGTNNIKVLCECKLLVIDDLGAKKTGEDWLTDILFKIFDYRYQNGLVTIVTSNARVEHLLLDDRLASRIAKLTQRIPLPEFSYRQKESDDDKKDFFKRMNLT